MRRAGGEACRGTHGRVHETDAKHSEAQTKRALIGGFQKGRVREVHTGQFEAQGKGRSLDGQCVMSWKSTGIHEIHTKHCEAQVKVLNDLSKEGIFGCTLQVPLKKKSETMKHMGKALKYI